MGQVLGIIHRPWSLGFFFVGFAGKGSMMMRMGVAADGRFAAVAFAAVTSCGVQVAGFDGFG